MFKQKNYFALGAVIVVAVLILSLPASATTRLKFAISSWFLPLFGLADTAQRLPADLADTVLPRRELLQQIANLRTENQQLKEQQIQTAAIARENQQLRTSLNWQKQAPWKLKLANVVTRDPANWWRTIDIDLGSRDGLSNNLPVLTASGLVGRVSALVENAARDTGVLLASGPVDTSLVQLTYLASSANLKSGQSVVTSGLGGIFPKGIPIGQIVDARSVEFGLYTEARVKLNANLGSLEQVWVLFP